MERKSLLEQIVDRFTTLFQRNPRYAPPPDEDSAIETRRSYEDSMDTASGSSFDWYADETTTETKRAKKYDEYDRMDIEAVEIASALDIYADNATSGDRDDNDPIEVISKDDRVVAILTEAKRRMNLDFELWSIAREMVKFGDCFEEVVAHSDGEIHRLKHLSPESMRVIEDEWGRLDPQYPYEQTDSSGDTVAKFRNWQIIHFRIAKRRDTRYGVDGSLLYPLRKVFKQLAMIEDSLVIARLTRAQQRFAFMVDVNGVEPGDATVDYLKQVKNMMKKKRTIDPMTGKMDLKYNPLSVEEDVFLARREGGGSDVKVLQGASNLSQLQDVEYFSKKLFAGLKVPKAWLGFEGDTRARAVITELDVQFAKTVRRVQQALIEGLRKLFDEILISRKIDPSKVEYKIRLPIMSIIDEMRAWQMEAIKTEVARSYRADLGIGSEWIYKNLLHLSDEDIATIRSEIEDENSVDSLRAKRAQDYNISGRNYGAELAKLTQTPPQASPPKDTSVAQLKAPNTVPKEAISKKDMVMLERKLKQELDSLRELIDWELEHKTGKPLDK